MHAKSLAILSSHPIQYHGEWFRKLASQPNLKLEVFYCHRATPKDQAAAGFGVEFDWDVSLLEEYPHRFLHNVARRPNLAEFRGLDTPEIKNIIASEDFDAVMINGWHYKSAWQAMRACWNTRTPVMVRSDSHLHTGRSLAKRIAKRPFYSWFISKLDACLPVGRWSSDYFLHYGALPERVFVVPHVIDTEYFVDQSARLASQRPALRSRWGLSPSSTVFLFVGKFIEKKRPLDFVAAVARAGTEEPNIAGLMVGDGQLRQACENLVHQDGLPIKFAGFLNQSEIVDAYAAADVLVLPSDGGETWGLVVNEAMACGLPCIVSDQVGCGPDLIQNEKTGTIFQVGDVESLAKAMVKFRADPKQLSEMSKHASNMAKSFQVRVAVERTMDALAMVAK